jgi:signal transduction histidine kinase
MKGFDRIYSSVRWKLLLAVGLLLMALTVSGTMYFTSVLQANLYEAKRQQVREMVQAASGILTHHHELVQQGKLSGEKARIRSREILRNFTFGPQNKDYFWITDLQDRVVMHPFKPDSRGPP